MRINEKILDLVLIDENDKYVAKKNISSKENQLLLSINDEYKKMYFEDLILFN